MGKTKYLTSTGKLSRKDDSLCFRVNDKNIYLPIKTISEIYCLSEVSMNSKLFDFLSKNEIIVHFFTFYEGYIGTFYPNDLKISGNLLLAQTNAYYDKRLKIAKSIVRGIGKNIEVILYHYYKHEKKEVKSTINWIKYEMEEKINYVENIKQVLQVEGEIWQRFYSCFKYFLPQAFVINKRIKRPPNNPMNALISFGNSLLYTKTISIIYKTHLDQRISFLHEPSNGRFSLSLDICEVFKPIIVFKTIFELVNNRKLSIDKHFYQKDNSCFLNDKGRKIYIEAFEKRLDNIFYHSTLKRNVSFKTAIRQDCYKLIKELLENKTFEPFSLKEMR